MSPDLSHGSTLFVHLMANYGDGVQTNAARCSVSFGAVRQSRQIAKRPRAIRQPVMKGAVYNTPSKKVSRFGSGRV